MLHIQEVAPFLLGIIFHLDKIRCHLNQMRPPPVKITLHLLDIKPHLLKIKSPLDKIKPDMQEIRVGSRNLSSTCHRRRA